MTKYKEIILEKILKETEREDYQQGFRVPEKL